jgi:hypothetical protein
MDTSPSGTLAAMDRLRAEIDALRQRLADTTRQLEARSQGSLLAETPLADHDYRLARDAHDRVRARLRELQSQLGALILEHEAGPPSDTEAPSSQAG